MRFFIVITISLIRTWLPT